VELPVPKLSHDCFCAKCTKKSDFVEPLANGADTRFKLASTRMGFEFQKPLQESVINDIMVLSAGNKFLRRQNICLKS